MFNVETSFFFIAYGGLLIHIILKLAELPGSLFSGFTKKDLLVTIASAISIPIILIICTDTSIKDLLPINYVTSFLVGYQTQSFLKTISSIGGKIKTKNDEQV